MSHGRIKAKLGERLTSKLEKKGFNCDLKLWNDLPVLPAEPKSIKRNANLVAALSQFRPNSLEIDMNFQHTTSIVQKPCVPIDLQTVWFRDSTNAATLSPEDSHLTAPRKKNAESKGSTDHSWLMSSPYFVPGNTTKMVDTSAVIARQSRQNTRAYQLAEVDASIEESFVHAQNIVEGMEHHRQKGLKAKKVYDILPDFATFGQEIRLVKFDVDPLATDAAGGTSVTTADVVVSRGALIPFAADSTRSKNNAMEARFIAPTPDELKEGDGHWSWNGRDYTLRYEEDRQEWVLLLDDDSKVVSYTEIYHPQVTLKRKLEQSNEHFEVRSSEPTADYMQALKERQEVFLPWEERVAAAVKRQRQMAVESELEGKEEEEGKESESADKDDSETSDKE
jgi:hypothetical protein